MKLASIGTDVVTVNEQNLSEISKRVNEKIHLIKFDFDDPTKDKILSVVNTFTKTNRYVISNNVKIYNDVLKTTGKKYYIENAPNINFISYLRKNNKLLLNFNNLRKNEQALLWDEKVLLDVLHNVEVIQIPNVVYEKYSIIFNAWDGNIIISEA